MKLNCQYYYHGYKQTGTKFKTSQLPKFHVKINSLVHMSLQIKSNQFELFLNHIINQVHRGQCFGDLLSYLSALGK